MNTPWQLAELNTHTASAFPNVMWIEYVAPRSELHGEQIFKSPVFEEEKTEDGVFLKPCLKPGFGFELDEAVADKILIRE